LIGVQSAGINKTCPMRILFFSLADLAMNYWIKKKKEFWHYNKVLKPHIKLY